MHDTCYLPSYHRSFLHLHVLLLFLLITTLSFASSNPILPNNFPDPCIIHHDGTYYAFATRTRIPNIHIQVASAPASDFWTGWKFHEAYDAMPDLPPWVSKAQYPGGEVWSPDVNELPDGSFVMYFAAASARTIPGHYQRQHCIGAALSKDVVGPYQPIPNPLACDLVAGGAIDPDGFLDPPTNRSYLVYKVDGNALGKNGTCSKYIAPTPIVLQEVYYHDRITLIGELTVLLQNGRYDGICTEAPSLVYLEGRHYLIFNSHCFAKTEYGVHYAVSYKGVEGPYVRQPRPLLVTGMEIGGRRVVAPGGVDVDANDSSRIVFHSDTAEEWFGKKTFDPVGRVRSMFAAELVVEDGGLLGIRWPAG